MKHKKAFSFIMGLILLIIVAIILFLFVGRIQDDYNKTNYRFRCQKSVEFQAITRLSGGVIDSPFDVDCHRYVVKFFNDRVEIDGKKAEVTVNEDITKKFDALTENIVNQVLANELAWCWMQFHSGQMDIFNKDFTDILNRNKICFICDEVSFDIDVVNKAGLDKDGTGATFGGFYNYLKETENQYFGGKYYDYIAGNDRFCNADYTEDKSCWEGYIDASLAGKFDVHKPLTRDIVFNKFDKYYIFFVREGARTGGGPGTYFSYIMDAKDYSGQCDKQLPSKS